jgi:hypothetical protein
MKRRDFLQVAASSLVLGNLASTVFATDAEDRKQSSSVLPIDDRLRDAAEHAPLAMQFRGETPEDAKKWQTEFSAKCSGRISRRRIGKASSNGAWNYPITCVTSFC